MDLQTQVEKKLCEDEHLYFTRRFFKPRMGFKFMVNWHHEYVAWLIDEVVKENIDNLVINVPPGAGKTELTTNLIPRGLALNARSRFLYLSFSQSLVEGVSDTARDIVKSKTTTAVDAYQNAAREALGTSPIPTRFQQDVGNLVNQLDSVRQGIDANGDSATRTRAELEQMSRNATTQLQGYESALDDARLNLNRLSATNAKGGNPALNRLIEQEFNNASAKGLTTQHGTNKINDLLRQMTANNLVSTGSTSKAPAVDVNSLAPQVSTPVPSTPENVTTKNSRIELVSGNKTATLSGSQQDVDTIEEIMREFEMLKRSS